MPNICANFRAEPVVRGRRVHARFSFSFGQEIARKPFKIDTKLLFNEILLGEYKLVISDLTVRELVNAPDRVRNLLRDLKIDFEVIAVTQESIDLATVYISEKVVGQTSLDDSIHIETATVHKLDLLISWNFKHIVNVLRIRGYNAVNLRNGYSTLEIRSPKDLINYEN